MVSSLNVSTEIFLLLAPVPFEVLEGIGAPTWVLFQTWGHEWSIHRLQMEDL